MATRPASAQVRRPPGAAHRVQRRHDPGLVLLLALAATAQGLDMDQRDKQQHAVAGVAIFSITHGLASLPDPRTGGPVMGVEARRWTALAVTLAAGLAKEAYDLQHRDRHDPDWRDAAATVAGAGMVSVVWAWTF